MNSATFAAMLLEFQIVAWGQLSEGKGEVSLEKFAAQWKRCTNWPQL
jgi:hypothetical protein